MVNYGLKDKVALITGANTHRGLGQRRHLLLLVKGQKWF